MIKLPINSNEVKAKIKMAFANVKLQQNQMLLRESSCDEFEIEDFFNHTWKTWQDVPEEIIDYNYSALPFFSPEGLRFFLPAYMIYGIDHLFSNVLDFTIYKLISPKDSDDPESLEFFVSWVEQLTHAQKTAIALFLHYIKQEHDRIGVANNDADEALQSYWIHFS